MIVIFKNFERGMVLWDMLWLRDEFSDIDLCKYPSLRIFGLYGAPRISMYDYKPCYSDVFTAGFKGRKEGKSNWENVNGRRHASDHNWYGTARQIVLPYIAGDWPWQGTSRSYHGTNISSCTGTITEGATLLEKSQHYTRRSKTHRSYSCCYNLLALSRIQLIIALWHCCTTSTAGFAFKFGIDLILRADVFVILAKTHWTLRSACKGYL